ncbi:MAG: nucleotidyltransferase family protein [Aminobacterium sp.]|jgi:D-glycero-alpha-D-manno-heptose 1-phosphate guanylyltransferase|uniref:nucleotidyltransferase family protein n=1 Tax=unclassified Aminobacterium TaxID=2685012 RepID=UPI001BCE6DB7|nr:MULTISPECIES: nucleotidyltransferase family protein [unclassified Aminobacterium]MDD2206104.1 nucleotidyltransferase family protein [Aminobacterium sp.]MDD3707823.1 nucleotidyltransferase family protein [Aminobacterium sp.]MDD4228052.1 nucleotidyltransferase family protein [Aminobacterium sp.]MDD4551101.1 nucleotidyltransferase family protein [Aminobacterium sp.]MEA4876749.1 nucleotidyltransferase family protein [Aminobacterium sp.]
MKSELAVILAGGLGTRLRSVVSDRPKALALIGGKPFLHWLFLFLRQRGIGKCLLLLGYKADQIREYCQNGEPWGLSIEYSVEPEPLDKAGALRYALPSIQEDDFLFLNGDTLLDVDIESMFKESRHLDADVVIALRKWPSIERTDPVEIDEDKRVLRFGDSSIAAGDDGQWLINGGLYVVKRKVVEDLPEGRLSWEKDVLPALLERNAPVYAHEAEGFFVDIGVPDDYQKSQKNIPEFIVSLDQ